MTELAGLPVQGISIHAAQYMLTALCELHAVPRLVSKYDKNDNKIIFNKFEKKRRLSKFNE